MSEHINDWKTYVRDNLLPPGLTPEREMEVIEELTEHMEAAYEDALWGGASEEEARKWAAAQVQNLKLMNGELILPRRTVRRQIVNQGRKVEERLVQAGQRNRAAGVLVEVLQDVRFGLRVLFKRRGFTAVTLLTLALGIGANTALFSVFNIVLLNPFPYPGQDQLFVVRQRLPQLGVQEQLRASGPEVEDFSGVESFEGIGVYEPVSRNLTGGQEPERLPAAKVSADFFRLLGVEPIMGRPISADDQGSGGQRVLVISHRLWQQHFGGDGGIIGRKVFLDDEPYIIIGVMPPHFWFDVGQAWFPFPMDMKQMPRTARVFSVIARLKPGLTPARAGMELEALARRQEQDFVGSNPEYSGRGVYLQSLGEFYFGPMRTALWVLFGAVGLILLIACANIANLLLAQTSVRRQEVAIRVALGATRGRVIRQLLTESVLLGLMGGALGLLLALWGTGWLKAVIPANTVPDGVEISIGGPALLFTLVTSLLAAVLFGLWPALQISNPALGEALKEGGQKGARGVHVRAQNLLVISEVALSLLLLVMAGLMIRSFARLINVDPGFNPENVLTMRLNLSPERYKSAEQKAAFFQQVIERVQALPGVEGAAAASHMPFVYTEDWTVTVESEALAIEARTQNIDTRTVSLDYFRVMGIDLRAGELFSAHDRSGAPGVVIINQAMARRFWPDEDPLGKRIKLGRSTGNSPWLTVKGVVADSSQGSLDAGINPEAYFHLAQAAGMYRRMNIAVRTASDPKGIINSVKREIQSLDPNQPMYQVQTMEELISESVGTRRFALRMLELFGALALLLAAIGIYGVLSYITTARTHEIGLRIALGARTGDVLGLVIGRGMRLALIGAGAGLLAAFALTRMMSRLLYGVSATDPLTFAGVALLLMAVALLACYLPARRAARTDPIIALRYE